ncbi:MAG: hypothetical protein JSW55_07205 [Chloroflexota bacterium]|nr:MAG: hypothetical protein JSW55_07205 [Chloroflexota bacterium]
MLIDMHPNGEPPPIEVHVAGEVLLAGHLQETNDFVEYYQADGALADVTARGLFELQRDELFQFMTHAPTIKALTDYLEANWSDAVVPEGAMARAAALMGEPDEGKEIVVREYVRLSRYRSSG